MKNAKTWTIYKHTLLLDCPENNWSYIGQTFKSVKLRWKNGKAYHSQPKFYKAIQTYGWENFKHEIIISGVRSQKEADRLEKFYIKKFHTFVFDKNCAGWNATKGGTGLKSLKYSTSSSKAIICIELNKVWPNAVEAAADLAANANGICMCCKQQRKTAYGYHWAYANDIATINRLVQYKNKNKLPKQAKSVLCIETGKIYSCLNSAAKDTRLKNGNSIGACCCGKRLSAGGFHWKYIS